MSNSSGRAAVLAALMLATTPLGARAQFFFWDRSGYSADDVARLALQHGFRPLVRPTRSNDVYLADVLDQRGRRERLVVSADTGDILQRYYLDTDRAYRRYADPTIPRGPMPPGRIPDDDDRGPQFSRLTPGETDRFAAPEEEAPVPRRSRRSRAAAVPTTNVARPAPVESAPLAPAVPAPAPLRNPAATAPVPAQAALPPNPPAGLAPSDRPIRPRNPLAIPGSREHDEEQAKASKAAAPSAPPVVAAPAPAKPAAVVKPVVPVAPLE